MKKTLVILVILFVSTNVWAARGVDCTDIKAPDLSDVLGFRLYDETVYQNKKWGASRPFFKKRGRFAPLLRKWDAEKTGAVTPDFRALLARRRRVHVSKIQK